MFEVGQKVMVRKDISRLKLIGCPVYLNSTMRTLGGKTGEIVERYECDDGTFKYHMNYDSYVWHESWLVSCESDDIDEDETDEEEIFKEPPKDDKKSENWFRTGKRVQVHPHLDKIKEVRSGPGIISEMLQYAGTTFSIERITSLGNAVLDIPNKDNIWFWKKEWLIPVEDPPSSCCRFSETTSFSAPIAEKCQKYEGGKSKMANVQVTFNGALTINRLMYLKGGLVNVPEDQIVSYPSLTDIITVKTPLANIKEGDIILREEDSEYYAVKEIIPGGYKALSFKTRTAVECAVTSAPEFPTLLNKVSYSGAASGLSMEKIMELGAYGGSSAIGRGIAEEIGRRLASSALDSMKPAKSTKV